MFNILFNFLEVQFVKAISYFFLFFQKLLEFVIFSIRKYIMLTISIVLLI